MNADRSFVPTFISISDLRADGRRLVKALRAGGPGSVAAAARFRVLNEFQNLSAEELAVRPQLVRLRHALAVLALEHGAAGWTELKHAAQRALPMHEPGMAALLNRWFATYDAARASLVERGGFLLPYRSQFFICEAEGVRLLGLDPGDPDWVRIGYDWVQPADAVAWGRLCERREAALARQRSRAAGLPDGFEGMRKE